MARRAQGPGRGRPCLLTKPARTVLLKAVANGTPVKFACAAAGLATRTVQLWVRQARIDEAAGKETIYTQFLRDFMKAEAEGVATRMAIIMKAASKDWKAAHAINLSRYPEHFDGNRHELRQLRKELAELKRLLEPHTGDGPAPANPPAEGE